MDQVHITIPESVASMNKIMSCDDDERVFKVQRYIRTLAPITDDRKGLLGNLVLIGYCQGFSDMEVLEMFIRQYIQSDQIKLCQSLDTVKSLIILGKQLTIIITGDLHCRPSITVSSLIMENNIDQCAESLRTNLSSILQQEKSVDDICSFAMIYSEKAERDYHLFFKTFRNATIFRCVNTLKIVRPLVSTHRESVLIVGGGIGGMATALSFAQAGIRVRLIEKNPQITEVGAGMQLAPNCSRLLDKLGILRQVQINAVFPKEIVWMDAISGQRLTSIDLGNEFIETFGYPYIVVHRADLLNALYQSCLASGMVTIETNRMAIDIDERPESMMVQCADGTRYDCDMVIAADGLWSPLRKFVCDDGPPISIGYVTYRGTIGIDQVSKEAGLENVQFWIGPDMHLVQYPIRRGELFNQAAVFKSNRLPDKTDQWGTKEELNQQFSIGCQSVKNALNLIQTNFRWPVYDRNPLSRWSRGRLVLLGDAAHPMLQYAAQGAAQAFEDADALVTAYKKHGPRKISTVFREYEQQRIPRSSKVIQFARDIGIFAHHSGTAKILRDAILQMHNKNNYNFIKWLYAGDNNGDQ